MSAAKEELVKLLAELLGSAEAVQRYIAFAREQANIGRALWNARMPGQERMKVIADFLRSGKPISLCLMRLPIYSIPMSRMAIRS